MSQINNTVKYSPPEHHYIQLDIAFATAYGVNEALIFAKLYRLLQQWEGKVDDNGDKWVRLTYEEWEKELPFFSRNTIIRTIERLEAEFLFLSVVFKGRSKWYRCNPGYVSTQNEQKHLPKMGKPSTQNGLLPNSYPNSKNPNNDSDKKSPKKLTPYKQLLSNLTKLYKIDIDLVTEKQKKQLTTETKKLLKAGKKPDDIVQFEKWWYRYDWRGKKGQPPILFQVSELWGQFEEQENNNNGQSKTLLPSAQNEDGSYNF